VTRIRIKIGPLGQRKLWGWSTFLSLPFGAVAYVTHLTENKSFTSLMVVVGIFLSCMALWLQTRVEVKVDPEIEDPKTTDS